jgi:hypothetical protein
MVFHLKQQEIHVLRGQKGNGSLRKRQAARNGPKAAKGR